MNEIAALESRITAALDRIRQGIETKVVPDQSPDLDAALAQERAANAALTEQLRGLEAKQEAMMASLTAQVAAQKSDMAALDVQLQRLAASNAQLRSMNTALREAVTGGLAPELVNEATKAEIEALAAQRAAEAAEVASILTELKPLIEEPVNAAD